VPDNENIDSLIKMLEDVGENELELGVLSQEEIANYQQNTAELSSRIVKKEVPVEAVEETSFEAEEVGVVEGDLTDLLNDIEIGLTEEKELEEQFRIKEEAEREAGPVPADEGPEEELPVGLEGGSCRP
jgi:hypothetical protein